MRIRIGRRSRTVSRAHVEGAIAGAVVAALVLGAAGMAALRAQADDLRWLGRRLVEKRRLVEQQRMMFARLVADVDRTVTSLEGIADEFGADAVEPPAEEAEYGIRPASSGIMLTPGDDAGDLIARLEAVEGRLAALGDAAAFRAAVGVGATESDVPSAWPVAGRVTSGFGMRVAPIRGGWRMHAGLDISAVAGTRVRAAGAGIVVFSGYRSGYGNTVVVDHGDGMRTLYGHMSRLATRKGRRVREGDILGFVGSTGRSTGPHLHFEFRLHGEPVNPICYLSRRPTTRRDDFALTTPG